MYAALVGLVLFFILFGRINKEPFRQKDYYHQSLAHLDSIHQAFTLQQNDTLQAGWSRQNITPPDPVNLMGYGFKGDYEQVHDSLFVRTVIFSDGVQRIALVSYDLMMVHPSLVAAVQQAIEHTTLSIDHIYYTAIHTHHGYGGWATGLSGKIIAGGYDAALVQMIVHKTLKSLEEATHTAAPVAIGYQQYSLPSLLSNRLVKQGKEDSLLRVVELRKKSGETGLICAFAAHATYLPSKSKDLSADYPGTLINRLEADTTVDFALFAAGAVGSHSPVKSNPFSYDSLAHYAEQMAQPVLKNLRHPPLTFTKKLVYHSLPVALGEPQLKISDAWRVRPWLFNLFFGKLHPSITLLQVGEIIFLGYPADFSGLLYEDIQPPPGSQVIITSFNGDYIGYIIPDHYYHYPHAEAREQNWFGPYTGSYFIDLTNRLLRLVSENE